MAQRCVSSLGDVAVGSGPLSGVGQAQGSLEALSARALRSSGAPSSALIGQSLTMVDNVAASRAGSGGGTAQPAQLATTTGGLSHIQVLSSNGRPGVWVSDDYAALLRVRAGGTLLLHFDDPDAPPVAGLSSIRVHVAGIYRQLVGTTLPAFWCSLSSVFGPPDSDFPPPPVILANGATFRTLLRSMHVNTLSFMMWEKPPTSTLSLPDAQRTAAGVQRFFDTVGSGTHHTAGRFEVTDDVDPQYTFVVAHAVAIQQAVRRGIVPAALAGVTIAALLMAAAGNYWADRRRLEVVLLVSRGVGPVALGLKASLEMLVPIGIGTALGWSCGVGLVALIGPSAAFGSEAIMEALWLALGGAVVGLSLLGLVAGLRARFGTERTVGSRGYRWARVPLEVVGLALTLWILTNLGDVSLEARGTSAAAVQTGFVVFPLVFLVSFTALFARLLVVGLRRTRIRTATKDAPVPLWLATRRLIGAPQAAGVVVAAIAIPLGIFVYAAALTQSEASTLNAKAETFVGSDIAANTNSIVRLPSSMGSTATEVLVGRNETVGSTAVDVIGVDPSTFGRGAFWDSSYSSSSLPSLMTELAVSARRKGPVPVIVAGSPSLSLAAGLSFTGYGASSSPLRVQRIDTATEFPGQNGTTPVLVMTRADLSRLDPDATSQIWAHGSESNVLASLGGARIRVPIVISSSSVLDQTSFAAIGWTFAYLESLGILIGAIAVGGLLLFVTSRNRSRALSYVLATRMGLLRRTHMLSLTLELGSLFAVGAVLGTALAWVAVEIVDAHLNPLPRPTPNGTSRSALGRSWRRRRGRVRSVPPDHCVDPACRR